MRGVGDRGGRYSAVERRRRRSCRVEPWYPKIAPFWPKAPAGTILGGAEYNHVGGDSFGPLKSDHNKYCPGYLTHAEREEQCVSLQEFTWGTDTLQRLEKIKKAVDPKGIFQCQKCVGFKGPV